MASLALLNSYVVLEVPSQGMCMHLFPNQALSSGVLIFLKSDFMPYVFKLDFDSHALTFGWFSSLFTTGLSSKNRVRSYLIRVFPLIKLGQ